MTYCPWQLMVSLSSLLMTYYFAACHLQFFIYEHIHQDNWRIGITGLLAQSLGLVPFKNVFWSSRWWILLPIFISYLLLLFAEYINCQTSIMFIFADISLSWSVMSRDMSQGIISHGHYGSRIRKLFTFLRKTKVVHTSTRDGSQ